MLAPKRSAARFVAVCTGIALERNVQAAQGRELEMSKANLTADLITRREEALRRGVYPDEEYVLLHVWRRSQCSSD